MYKSGSATVSYLDCLSSTFHLKQGVRQGSILSPHLYNIYTENLLEKITNDETVGTSIYGTYTGIVAYADDIIILSSTLSGLQKLVNKCNVYNNYNYIKLNPDKTEILVSGKQLVTYSSIKLSNTNIELSSTLKHLGFIWDNQHSSHKATLQQSNLNERITQFQAAGHALIRSGIRFTHPSTIVQLYCSLLVPKLIYGLELCDISNSTLQKLNITGRSMLKSLFNVSKHSRNFINQYFNLKNISDLVNQYKINLFQRLMSNPCTSKIILSQLENNHSSTFISDVINLCSSSNINFFDLLLSDKRFKLPCEKIELPNDTRQIIATSFKFWQTKEQRQTFKNLLEEQIPR